MHIGIHIHSEKYRFYKLSFKNFSHVYDNAKLTIIQKNSSIETPFLFFCNSNNYIYLPRWLNYVVPVFVGILLGRKLSMSNKGWPSQKGCQLISKPPSHPTGTHLSVDQESSHICYKITTETFPTLSHVPWGRGIVDTK